MPLGSTFVTSERIPDTGIYSVSHTEHRLPPEVILVKEQLFPRCAACSNPVTFTLVQAVRGGFEYEPVFVHALPVIEDDAEAARMG